MMKDGSYIRKPKIKNVLITGASSGLGQAVAIEFARPDVKIGIHFSKNRSGAELTFRKVKEKGGYVIAQDESTSVVYGMPKAALEAGVVDIILPANLIGEYISKYGIEVK